MTRAYFRFLSGIAVVLAGLAMQAQAPEPLPRFEVASVKQNTSGDSRMRMVTQPGGRLVVTNAPLIGLIATAFSVADSQSTIRSRVLGGPSWIDSERYDIDAKAAAEFQPTPGGPPRDMILMLRSLLEERFKLRTHGETRELPVYELVVARADGKLGPGLHKSDVDCDAVIAARRGGAPPPPRQPMEPPPCALMAGPARTIAGAASMQQITAHLTVRMERPVIDKTGLTDRFDFNLAFTPDQMPTTAPPPGVPPIDPNGPSLFIALQEQLGLKLQPAKGPVGVVVIDSIQHLIPD
jgi:uncharacterized protein (TIGR03435 family)